MVPREREREVVRGSRTPGSNSCCKKGSRSFLLLCHAVSCTCVYGEHNDATVLSYSMPATERRKQGLGRRKRNRRREIVAVGMETLDTGIQKISEI